MHLTATPSLATGLTTSAQRLRRPPGALNNSIGKNTISNALNVALANNNGLCP
jgi:hypothetical protein